MKKWIAMLLLLSLILTGCRPGGEELFFFDADRYDVVDLGSYDRTYYSSIKALENAAKRLPQGMIVKCTVIGGSLNKILNQSDDGQDVQTDTSHVLTPIRIEEIYYQGEGTDIALGDICYLYEDYYYVTDKTPKLLDYYGKNTVLVREYDPVIAADTYIIFAEQDLDRQEAYFQEKAYPLLPISGSGGIFPIADNWDTVWDYAGIANQGYYTAWADIMESYCDIVVPGAPPQLEGEIGPADDGTLTQEELDAFQELFAFHLNDDKWYNYALKSTYETAADVNLFELFYSAAWNLEVTEEEKEFLAKKGMEIEASAIHKYSVEKMDAVLEQYLGITLDETNGVGLDKLIYNPDTDSYYHMHGDFAASYCTITSGSVQEDGTIALYYTPQEGTGTQDTGKVTLQPKEDGGYQILSNVLVAEEQNDTLPVELWLADDREPLRYEDYLSQDIQAVGTGTSAESSGNEWVHGDTLWWIFNEYSSGLRYVCSDAYEQRYRIPKCEIYTDYAFIGTDGRWIYLYDDTEIIQVELDTGENKKLAGAAQVLSASLCGPDVLYYAIEDSEGQTCVFRQHIPSGQEELLCCLEEAVWFQMHMPQSTRGTLTWTMMNPEMLEKVKAELADPNSIYKKEGAASLWDMSEPLKSYGNSLAWLCYYLQEDTGVKALKKVTIDTANGTYTPGSTAEEKLGIIDNCWFGSGYPHDHYSPEITRLPDLTVELGQWTPLAGEAALADTGSVLYDGIQPLLYTRDFLPYELYIQNAGRVTKVADVKAVEAVYSENYIYCLTTENAVLQVTLDGIARQLYTSDNSIKQLAYCSGSVYFLDGDTLIQLDLNSSQYRPIMTHEGIKEVERMYGQDYIYLEVREGMYYQQYVYKPQEETVEETHFL